MNLLVVSEKGFGKQSSIDEYRITGRGGKGVITLNITEKTGNLVAIKSVTPEEDIMIITKNGITIRTDANEVREAGRNTQGVRIIRLKDNDEIASVAMINKIEDEGTEDASEEIEGVEPNTDTNTTES